MGSPAAVGVRFCGEILPSEQLFSPLPARSWRVLTRWRRRTLRWTTAQPPRPHADPSMPKLFYQLGGNAALARRPHQRPNGDAPPILVSSWRLRLLVGELPGSPLRRKFRPRRGSKKYEEEKKKVWRGRARPVACVDIPFEFLVWRVLISDRVGFWPRTARPAARGPFACRSSLVVVLKPLVLCHTPRKGTLRWTHNHNRGYFRTVPEGFGVLF